MSYTDSALTFRDLRHVNVRRNIELYKQQIDDWSPTDWACAAAGEMGETCNKIKKLKRGDDIPLSDVADEIADTVIYLDLLAARMGIDLAQAVINKFNATTDRFSEELHPGNTHKLPY
jgi:NTP pyrophosphatase (non-canonical NTP hydrolase)